MGRFQRSGWRTRKFFPGTMSWSKSDRAIATAIDEAVVYLIDPSPRLAATPIEQKLVSALTKATPLPLASLVSTVAGDLYAEELRGGAGILDIGLFGSRLFNGDVIRELDAGDGILWNIKQQRELL